MVLRLGIDGYTDTTALPSDDCCVHPCMDLCAVMCAYIDLLPNGPLWDRAKQEAMARMTEGNGTDPCEAACSVVPDSCASLVQYAMFKGQMLHDLVAAALWPALRESNPDTAVTTLDEWLARFEWEDCYRTLCRRPVEGQLSQFEIDGGEGCPPIYCEVKYPDALDCAVKRGTVRAIARANRGFIRNLAGFNFILEPLGAQVTPVYANECPTDYLQPADCCNVQIRLSNIDGTIEACPPPDYRCQQAATERLSVALHTGCDAPAGLPTTIYPNLSAAECIVRSLMPRNCPSIIISGYC